MATNLTVDDHSGDFHTIATTLKHPSGALYRDFCASLKPDYAIVWRDIALGYSTLAAIALVLIAIPYSGWPQSLAGVLLGAVAFGYVHQYLSLFMHEAAHSNVAATRAANDRLANLLLGVVMCYSLQAYRLRHFGHHRDIGKPEDPERHYFEALDARFFLRTLSGARTFIEIRDRLSLARAPARPGADPQPSHYNGVVLAGALVHGAVVLGSLWAGHWVLGVAWALGFLIGFPLFSMMRQILEHRDFNATRHTDYTKHPHGALTRIFGDGPLASTLGAAGFNRHLLHHWEPQVPYTRLPELERFLLETGAGTIIRARQQTYLSTLGILLRQQ